MLPKKKTPDMNNTSFFSKMSFCFYWCWQPDCIFPCSLQKLTLLSSIPQDYGEWVANISVLSSAIKTAI